MTGAVAGIGPRQLRPKFFEVEADRITDLAKFFPEKGSHKIEKKYGEMQSDGSHPKNVTARLTRKADGSIEFICLTQFSTPRGEIRQSFEQYQGTIKFEGSMPKVSIQLSEGSEKGGQTPRKTRNLNNLAAVEKALATLPFILEAAKR